MKVFKDGKDKGSLRDKSGKAFKGGFEDMMKERKKHLPELKETIEEAFKDYSGEMVAVVRIHEDENGDPESSTLFVGGVATFGSSLKMLKALDEAKSAIQQQMGDGLKDNPEVIGEILGDMLSDIIKKHSK